MDWDLGHFKLEKMDIALSFSYYIYSTITQRFTPFKEIKIKCQGHHFKPNASLFIQLPATSSNCPLKRHTYLKVPPHRLGSSTFYLSYNFPK